MTDDEIVAELVGDADDLDDFTCNHVKRLIRRAIAAGRDDEENRCVGIAYAESEACFKRGDHEGAATAIRIRDAIRNGADPRPKAGSEEW